MHLSGLFKILVLQIQVAVIRTHRIFLRCLDDIGFADDERKSRHRHQPLLCRGHTEIDIVFCHIDRAHRQRGCGIRHKDRTVLMRQRTDLADRI